MHDEPELGPIQAGILRELFTRSRLRFAELNVNGLPSDQFSYHLRQLTKVGFIVKDGEGCYRLSTFGKSRAIMLDPDQNRFIAQGFIAVLVVLTRQENDEQLYLVQQRSNEPYKGSYQAPGDKILFGENVETAARRAIEEQTNLKCEARLRGAVHYLDSYEGDLVQDKYFFVCSASGPQGRLKPRGRTGDNIWLSRSDISNSPLTIQGLLEIIDISSSDQMVFSEHHFQVDTY